MTLDFAWNISKLAGVIVGLAGLITVIARAWMSASRDKIIELLKSELEIARPTVEHYRKEMHETRKEAQGKVSQAELRLEQVKEQLKAVEIQNASLTAKTDLSPVMRTMTDFILEQRQFIKDQTAINGQILESLRNLTKTS